MADDRYRRGAPGPVLEQIRQFQQRVRNDRHDADAWEALVGELRAFSPIDDMRAAYEELVSVYPAAAFFWAQYAEMEIHSENAHNATNIFQRCLLTCPTVELWSTYLKFIKKNNEGKGPEGLKQVREAYEFTLERIGQDINSGPLWQEYLQLLQQPKPGTPGFNALFGNGVPGQEEGHRLLVIRRAYHRALAVPTHLLETLWRMYEAFENLGSNKQFARRQLDDQRPKYQHTRQVHRDRKRKMEVLDLHRLPLPPGTGGSHQEEQLRLWWDVLDWERSNPQKIEPATLNARVCLAFDQALMPLWFYPEVWYEYSRWHSEGAGTGLPQAAAVLVRSQKAVPDCLMLRLALADMEEAQGKIQDAKQVYEAIVAPLEAEGAAVNGAGGGAPHPSPEQQVPADLGALAWIHYMRFLRRAETVTDARKLFLRAKKWARCPWQVYAASALMEWRQGKDHMVARKIFEKGLESPTMLTDTDYLLNYIEFLISIGDTDNVRQLFERVMTEEANRSNRRLWERYVEFEFDMGDLETALRLERRAKETLGGSNSTAMGLLVHRYQYLGYWACTPKQRHHLEVQLGLVPMSLLDNGEYGTAGRRPMEPEPLKQLPAVLGNFLNSLPPPQALEGPSPDLEAVLAALQATDLSPAAIATNCMEMELTGFPNMLVQPAGQVGPSGAYQGGQPGFEGGQGGMPAGGFSPGQGAPVASPSGVGQGAYGGGPKRKFEEGEGGYMEEDAGVQAGGVMGAAVGGPTAHDIYRRRIKQRVKMEGAGDG